MFRRTAPARVEKPKIENDGLGIDNALDLDVVLPALSKVVKVAQRLDADIFENFDALRLARIERAVGSLPLAPP